MQPSLPARAVLAAALAAGLAACGGGSGTAPAPPVNPNPVTTPVPSPTPTPNAFAQACGTPLPPFEHSYGFGVKVQLEPTRNRKVLNASPLIRNAAYCASAGLPGTICNTRFEDNPQRVPCDHYLSGISLTGRPGPDWFQDVNGRLLKCGGQGVPAEAPNCELKESNQYLLDITAGGQYVACGGVGSPGICGGCLIDQDTFGIIHNNPAGLCKPS